MLQSMGLQRGGYDLAAEQESILTEKSDTERYMMNKLFCFLLPLFSRTEKT